jgi:hypothetical protein
MREVCAKPAGVVYYNRTSGMYPVLFVSLKQDVQKADTDI